MKRPPAAGAGRLKSLAELKSVVRLGVAPAPPPARAGDTTTRVRVEAATEFLEAMRGVTPLPVTRRPPAAPRARPHPVQRERDNRAVLDESLADRIGVETLLDTDEALSYRRHGIGADTLRKLRRGGWVVQAELDLHGHRVAEAHEALGAFLREAMQRGQRCVRIVHGKGHGSRDGVPVLKGKVRKWLARRSDVIAFCQARPADGGAGALLVLLKPSAGP
jgi:DNA-nicking Smr family endonuclease